jgi:Domain of unknown function (DUF5134)
VGGADWVRWVLAAMFAALTIFYMIRLLISDRETSHRGVDVSRGVMSLGMVAMMAPQIDPLPRLCWQLLFGLAAGYIAIRLVRRALRPTLRWLSPLAGGHHELHLLIGGLAMVYMFALMPAGPDPGAGVPHDMVHGGDMAQMGSTELALPVLTWVFVGYFLVFVVRLAARLAVPVPAGGPRGMVVSPHLLGSSELVMGIGMSCMLLMML